MTKFNKPSLLKCPFCRSDGIYSYKRYEGTGASGMEPPAVFAGCKNNCASFSGGYIQDWTYEKEWTEKNKEVHILAASRWNKRV